MAKLVALLATLLVVAHVAVAYHTTITTVETIDSDNPSRQHSQECERELQGKDLNACMQYLKEKKGGGRYEMETRSGSDEYERCCNQLKSIHNEQCMCDGLKMEMERMSQPEMMQSMVPMAENLPRMCGAMSSSCNFRSRMY